MDPVLPWDSRSGSHRGHSPCFLWKIEEPVGVRDNSGTSLFPGNQWLTGVHPPPHNFVDTLKNPPCNRSVLTYSALLCIQLYRVFSTASGASADAEELSPGILSPLRFMLIKINCSPRSGRAAPCARTWDPSSLEQGAATGPLPHGLPATPARRASWFGGTWVRSPRAVGAGEPGLQGVDSGRPLVRSASCPRGSGQLLVLGGPVSFWSSGVRSASDPRGPVSFLSSGSGQLLILGVRSASCRRGSVRASALQSPPALTLIRKCLCSSFSSLVPDASRKGCLLLRRCVQPSSSVLFLHFLTK